MRRTRWRAYPMRKTPDVFHSGLFPRSWPTVAETEAFLICRNVQWRLPPVVMVEGSGHVHSTDDPYKTQQELDLEHIARVSTYWTGLMAENALDHLRSKSDPSPRIRRTQ